MCEEINLDPLMEELKLHRPVFPAPGWRVLRMFVDTNMLKHEFVPVIGWRPASDGSEFESLELWIYDSELGALSVDSKLATFENGFYVILAPGEEPDFPKLEQKALYCLFK